MVVQAEELLAMIERSVRHHLEAGIIFQGREILCDGRGLQGVGRSHGAPWVVGTVGEAGIIQR